MNEDAFEHLPKDLQDIGDALREHRDLADGHALERVKRRALLGQQDRSVRSFVPRRARSRAALILVVGLALNVSGAMASVLTSVGVSTTSANNLKVTQIVASVASSVSAGNDYQSAANHTYCDTQGTTYTKYGVMNGGGHDRDCCPDDSHSSMNTYGHIGGSHGDDDCCPDDSHSTMSSMHTGGSHGGDDQCCPSKSASGYVTINGHMEGGGSDQCCPSGSGSKYSSTYNHSGGGSDECCPSGSGSSYSSTYNHSGGGSDECCGSDSGSHYSSTNSNHGDPHGCKPPEKPGCGDEKNIGISGNSGAHGGQPPKKEERGDCPHDPGTDGN